MLKSLYIKNYAIIEELELSFSDGFTVFTGETGAGKSIIVGALSYLIKGKADPSVIRRGADKAIIEGIFSIEDYMKEALDEADIDYDDELIIRRVISADNHNSIKINQCSVTLAFLTSLFEEHIDIHSQKDSQYLLNKKNHLTLLDRYVKQEDLFDQYRTSYREYKKADSQYKELLNNTLKFSLYGMLDIDNLGYYVRSAADYLWSDQITLSFGADGFGGKRGTFKTYKKNTQIWVKGKYFF